MIHDDMFKNESEAETHVYFGTVTLVQSHVVGSFFGAQKLCFKRAAHVF